jgi:HlyD family secretion protein
MAGAETPSSRTLDRLSSPDRLDETIQIVGPSDWLPLLVVAVLVALALGWSIWGRVSTTVSGRGVLIRPRGVLELQTLGAGRVDQIQIRTGDHVKKGQIIGLVDQFELRRKLDEDRALLAELESQDKAKGRVQTTESARQKAQTALTREYARSQAENLRKSLADARALQPLIDQRLASVRSLRENGLIAASAPELLSAEQQSLENARRITDVTAQLKQLDVQIAQSEGIEMTLSRGHLEADSSRRAEIQRLKSALAINEVQIEQNSQIVASQDGRVLEVMLANGLIITAGARVATIDVDSGPAPLMTIGYLAIGVGKKVRPGMLALVTPDGVERQRYGGMTGRVTHVSDLAVSAEGVRAVVGNAELAQSLLAGGARIEVTVALDADPSNPSGYKWSSSSGPALPITPGLTGDLRVAIEERAPITYVLPFLRELTGTE